MKKITIGVIAMMCAFTSCSTSRDLDISGDWWVESISGAALPKTMEDAMIEFDKSSSSYHAMTGVNIINGSYRQVGDSLILEEGAMTQKMGDSISMDVESRFVIALRNTRTVKLGSNELILRGDRGEELLKLNKR